MVEGHTSVQTVRKNSMTKFHRISVVVPAFNEEKYITPCLESLVSQNYPKDKYDIIVELSGSSDRTSEIAKSFGAKIVDTGKKEGVSTSRDNGARAASGEIVAQTDGDTVVPINWLATINQHFQNEEIVGITGPVEFANTNWFYKLLAKFGYTFYVGALFTFGKSIFTGMNFAISKEVFNKIGGFNKTLLSNEDVDLGFRASKAGKVIFARDLKVYTSARRIEKSPLGFIGHHILNALGYLFLKKSRGFENIR